MIALLLQPVKNHIVRRVIGLADLLQDHAALDLDLARIKDRVQDDIANHIHRQRHIVFQNARVIGRHLARGIGVDIPAHILDRFGDLQRRPTLGSLERHMLKEMRNPVLLDPFMPPTGGHPDADGR